MKKIIFIRHGATPGNLEKRYVGRTDEGLCEEGKKQARALASKLCITPDIIFVSPYLRARETAEILFPKLTQTEVYGLREMDFGDFEMKTPDEMENDPRYREWVEKNCLGAVPGGENTEDFKARCVSAVRECIRKTPEGKTAAVVTHGGVIMAALEALDGKKLSFYDYYVRNAEAVVCAWENGAIKTLERI